MSSNRLARQSQTSCAAGLSRDLKADALRFRMQVVERRRQHAHPGKQGGGLVLPHGSGDSQDRARSLPTMHALTCNPTPRRKEQIIGTPQCAICDIVRFSAWLFWPQCGRTMPKPSPWSSGCTGCPPNSTACIRKLSSSVARQPLRLTARSARRRSASRIGGAHPGAVVASRAR